MKEISPEELHSLLQQQEQEIFLLDVREEAEHDEFNIGGLLIPLDGLLKAADQVPENKTVIVYCKKGIRSQLAIQRLERSYGFNNLINLKGGIEAWKKYFL